MMHNTDHGSEQLDTVGRLAYDMSQQSYLAPDKRARNVQGYVYDKEMSNTDTAVYHNHTTHKTHVSNRGSTSGYDWGVSDVQVATGTEKYGSRFKRAVKQTEDAHNKYKYNVSTSGHSLGGRASSYTTEKLGNNDWYESGTGFNPGVSSLGGGNYFSKTRRACRGKNPPAYCAKQTRLTQGGDYVGGRNIACGALTLGLGGKMCRKGDYAKTKYYDHHPDKSSTLKKVVKAVMPGGRLLKFFNKARTTHSPSLRGSLLQIPHLVCCNRTALNELFHYVFQTFCGYLLTDRVKATAGVFADSMS